MPVAISGIGLGTLMWLAGRFLERDQRAQASDENGYSAWYKVVTAVPDD